MLTEEQAASAYELVTDGCRHALVGTRDNARQWQRVKADRETNPLADLDCEKGADVGSARAADYSSASEYVRWIVIMPSASNCAAATDRD